GQILVATTLGVISARLAGLSFGASLVIGIAVSVASTVVLIRVLMDNDVLQTPQGHIAVGWLIVEDVFTVLVLVALPAVAEIVLGEGQGPAGIAAALGLALLKMVALAVLVLGGGRRVIPWLLAYVARTRSRELFTLS